MANDERREPLDPVLPPEDVEPTREREADREAERQAERTDRDRVANPPHTTSDGVTAPKFGSAGSGGAEYEPGPGT